jgi:transcriptional regulator with XRE-family HTH domain
MPEPTNTTERPHQGAGEVLREKRHAVGLTHLAMAERVGRSEGHLAAVESGERALTVDLADRIARATADHVLEKAGDMSTTTERVGVIDDLTAQFAAAFDLLDYGRQDQLLDYWEQLLEEQRAAKAPTA